MKKTAGAALASAALLAGLSTTTWAEAPSGSTAQGIVSTAGRSQQCVTATAFHSGAAVMLERCNLNPDAHQEWSLLWVKLRTNSTSGPVRMCLTAHPNLCLGLGTISKSKREAAALLYDDSNGDPNTAIHNALTLFRSNTGSQEYRFGANAIKGGARLTTSSQRFPRPGDALAWQIPQPTAPTLYVLPRFHKPKN